MTAETSSTPARWLKIGGTTLALDATTAQLDTESLRTLLQPTYPEIAYATVRERTLEDGTPVTEFLPAAGRKG